MPCVEVPLDCHWGVVGTSKFRVPMYSRAVPKQLPNHLWYIIHWMGLNSNIFDKWSGGMRQDVARDKLVDGQAWLLENWRVIEQGTLSMRAGRTKFDISGFPAGTPRAQHLFAWYPYASGAIKPYLFASIDGDVYSFDTIGQGAVRFSTANTPVWCFESMQQSTQDFLYMVNGVDTPQRYNPVTDSMAAWPTAAPPTKCTMLRSWRNFMVASGNADFRQRVYFSALGDPQAWTVGTDFVDIGSSDEEQDPITWMDILGNDLIVFKRNSVWRISAGPPTPVVTRVGDTGCWGRFQSAELEGRLYFFTGRELWSMDSRNDSTLIPLQFESQQIPNSFGLGGSVDSVRVVAGPDRRIYISQFQNNAFWEFVPWMGITDEQGIFRPGAWFRHSYRVFGMCKWKPFAVTTLVGGNGNSAAIDTLFSGTTDSGVAFTATYQSPWKEFAALEYRERVRRVNVLMEGAIGITLRTEDAQQATASLSTFGALAMKRYRPDLRARMFLIEFTSADPTTKIYSIEAVVRGRKEH